MNAPKHELPQDYAKVADKIRGMFPGLTEDKFGDFLWACSPYPFKSITDCVPGLEDLASRSLGNYLIAMDICAEEAEIAMARFVKDANKTK